MRRKYVGGVLAGLVLPAVMSFSVMTVVRAAVAAEEWCCTYQLESTTGSADCARTQETKSVSSCKQTVIFLDDRGGTCKYTLLSSKKCDKLIDLIPVEPISPKPPYTPAE